MIGRITIKRAMKRTVGCAAVLTAPFTGLSVGPKACIFYYHRIADIAHVDPNVDDWNVPPSLFERQIAMLASFGEFVPLLDLPRRLALASTPTKPLVCLTFDDGYANFCTQALPILKRYNAPATIFVITSLIEHKEPPPFDSWSQRNRHRVPAEAWRHLNWSELEACLSSGLVTLGAHSHEHLKGRECTQEQLNEEAGQSRAILQSRFGENHALVYAYPYGNTRLGEVSAGYVRAVRAAGYQLAVTTDLGLACANSDPYLMPRVEAHAVDASSTLRAKALGVLAPFHLAHSLRIAKHFV